MPRGSNVRSGGELRTFRLDWPTLRLLREHSERFGISGAEVVRRAVKAWRPRCDPAMRLSGQRVAARAELEETGEYEVLPEVAEAEEPSDSEWQLY